MKKILLFVAVAVITLLSCEKEEQIQQQEMNDQISNSMVESEGLFKQEIIVTDESGKNSAFYAIYSDDENLLSEYLEVNEFLLLINNYDIDYLKSAGLSSGNQLKSGTEGFDLDQEPKIIVELVTTNLQENVLSYSLEVNLNKLKSTKDFIIGYPVGYTTKNDFIGVIHKGTGYEFIMKLRYKTLWRSRWKYLTVDGANAWFIEPNGDYFGSITMSSYKLGIVIYPLFIPNNNKLYYCI